MENITPLHKPLRLGALSFTPSQIKQEVLAGITTFFTMSYSVFTAPLLLGVIGMSKGAVITAVCLCSALGCLLMGLCTNLPIACGASISIMLFFATELTHIKHLSWQEGLGLAMIVNCLFLALSYYNIRSWLIQSIPCSLKSAITAGIAILISLVALKLSDAFHWPTIHLSHFIVLKPFCGFMLSLLLLMLLIRLTEKMAFVLMLLTVTLITHILSHQWPGHLIHMPASIQPNWLHLTLPSLHQWAESLSTICALLMIYLLDCSATLYSLVDTAGLLTQKNINKKMDRGMLCTGGTSIMATLMGCSLINFYFESANGIKTGGKTGLTAIVTATMFLVTLLCAPLIHMVPHFAIAAGLFHTTVSITYAKIKTINWYNPTLFWPCLLILIIIPVSHSIPNGIGVGILSYHWLTRNHPLPQESKRKRLMLNLFFLTYFLLSL
jgi:adenine/guanine/hypoxanthine permease